MKVSPTSRRMIVVICIAALVMAAGGIIVSIAVPSIQSLQAIWFPLGVLLTSGVNVLKVFLLDRAIAKTLDMENPSSGSNYIRIQYLLRYLLTGAVLVAAGLISTYCDPPFISIWGALAGVFTLQIAVIVVRSMKPDDGE